MVSNGSKRPAPNIAREAWALHPHYPEQVLLLGSHENFRRMNAYLSQEAKRSKNPRALEGLYRRWISAMRSHEAYEEHKLYPYLARRWGVSFGAAEVGHRLLHEKHASVLHAFGVLEKEPKAEAPRALLVTALTEHEAVLVEHLRVEEDLVIPLLLELDGKEFQTFCNTSIRSLLRTLEEREGSWESS